MRLPGFVIARFVALAMLLPGCIIPFAIPPTRSEIGSSTRIGRASEPGSSSLHAAVGTHLASGTQRRDQAFDVGAGWTFEKTTEQTSNGVYLDGAVFIDRTARTRTSLGGRGELRSMTDGKAAAAKLRLDTEVYGGGTSKFSSNDRCGTSSGTYFGTTAVGMFAEAGHVWSTGPEGNAWVATAGVSMRIPSSVGVWIGIPGC
ncbi:MAG: hypothetical protein H0T89_02100 [Deltaproteobacteria bacterium]|nr:hypothetical protein [Deltaproteobacteria bacterium]